MHQVTSRDQESRAKENPETAQVIAVDSVTFEGNLQFPITTRARLATELEERDFDARADWTAQATQLLGGAWREMGYLKAAPAISYKVVSNDSIREHVTLTVRVAEGPQYSLGHLRLRLSDPEKNPLIASEELEQRASLRERDILNTRKIEDIMEILRRTYSNGGYLDVAVIPVFEMHDAERTVDVTMQLDLGPQYRIGEITVIGLDMATENVLRTEIKPGDLFGNAQVRRFFEANRSNLPPGASAESVTIKRNPGHGTVDLVFDFSARPAPPQP